MKPSILYTLVVAAAVISGVSGYYFQRSGWLIGKAITSPPPAAPLEERTGAAQVEGLKRPDFSLADVNGKIRRIDEWDGHVIALNFWATWCPPCREEIPEFVDLQSKYAGRGLQIVGIALQSPDEVKGFMEEHHINYPVLAGETKVLKLSRAYGNDIGALPYTVIIDRKGRIAFVKQGRLSGEIAEEVISRLL